MTIQEMHNRILLRVQKIDSNVHDTILSEEVDEYINHAIVKFIKDRLEPRSNRFRLGFEQSIKRIEDLRTHITTDELDTTEVAQKYFNNIFVDKATIPDDHLFLLSIGLKVFYNSNGISYTVSSSKRQPDGTQGTDYEVLRTDAKFIQHDDLYAVLDDPFNRPIIRRGIFTIDNTNIYSYTNDNFITDKILTTYIRQPVEVSLSGDTDCDLSEGVHDEIVDLTAKLILSDLSGISEAQFQSLTDTE